MAAPAVCMASRLSSALWFMLVLNLHSWFIWKNVSALLVYDRETLLSIRESHGLLFKPNAGRYEQSDLPPPPPDIPAYLWRYAPLVSQRKHPRKRGKRGGVLVRVRAFQRATYGSVWGSRTSYGYMMSRRRWLVPIELVDVSVAMDQLSVSTTQEYLPPRCARTGGYGVDLRNLR
ncbi:hypothetical protein WMY93_012521 [Mugilogobius chulae]